LVLAGKNMSVPSIGIIVLAAGGSRRFGGSKQQLQFEGKSLFRRSVETALGCESGPVLAVLGSDASLLEREIKDLPVKAVINPAWESGLSSSIKTGIAALRTHEPDIAAAVLMLCDQPFVTSHTISSLIETYRSSGAPVVACHYDGSPGVPALFAGEMFSELMDLTGDRGAKSLIIKHAARSVTIDAPEAAFDVDHPEDYRRLINEEH
jgi:molybdenum cofactor cytidylyltransferase